MVDAVYAEAELDAGARRPGDSQAADYTAAKWPDTTANGTGPAARGVRERDAWTRKTDQNPGYGKHAVNLMEHMI
jgi:hypothetical protein